MGEKPTYEQLEFRVKDREHQLENAKKAVRESNEECRTLRLLLTAVADKGVHLRITLSPEIFDKNSFDAVQVLQREHAKRTAYEIEQMIGGPLRELQRALMHIHYLENHATSRGLPFSPFAWKQMDRNLLY